MQPLHADEIDQFFAYETDHGVHARNVCDEAKRETDRDKQLALLETLLKEKRWPKE